MQLLAKEHQWAFTYRDQISAAVFQGKLLPPPPRGGQAPELPPGSCISILIKASGYRGSFCLRKIGDFPRDTRSLRNLLHSSQPLKTPVAISSLSECVMVIKPILFWSKTPHPLGRVDHAHLLSSIDRFKQAVF